MRSNDFIKTAAITGTLVFGHDVRPITAAPCAGVRGDRIASTRSKRAP